MNGARRASRPSREGPEFPLTRPLRFTVNGGVAPFGSAPLDCAPFDCAQGSQGRQGEQGKEDEHILSPRAEYSPRLTGAPVRSPIKKTTGALR